MCGLSRFSNVPLFTTPWTVACQAPLSMDFFQQEYWSGLPCPSSGDLPNPGIEPTSPASPELQVNSLLPNHQRTPMFSVKECLLWYFHVLKAFFHPIFTPLNPTHVCMCVCVCVASHSVMSILCNPMDCIPPGSSVHRTLQARILE